MCFVENSHCFVSCASDGSINVVKVDTVMTGGVLRYGKLRVLREHTLPEGEFATWCEHFRQESASMLVLSTNRSRIMGIDLRTMAIMYVLDNPVQHGTPTCFCIDRKRNWLCVGTSHGVVDLWDLRFKMRLKGWCVPGEGTIYRINIHPTKGRGKWVCISGGTGQGEVTVWDLEKTLCREIYRSTNSKDAPKSYDAWDVDDDKLQRILGRFATSLEPNDSPQTDRGVRAMAIGIGAAEDSREVRHAYMLTGGSDKKLRFWDIGRVDNSSIYSGLLSDESAPTYTTSNPVASLTLNTERMHRELAPSAKARLGGGSRGKPAAGGGSGGGGGSRPARSTVISLQQQRLLKTHLDCVMDVAVLEYPYTMSVSVDRSGVVFIFQ
jgi:phosphoinositide-3-kinase regulatory subunit 4